jgi:signal transduction histidine kinase
VTAAGQTDLARDYEALLSMHAAVRADADRYRALFDAAPTALLVTTHDLVIVECNAAAARLLDVQERFLIGKPLTVYVDLGSRRLLRSAGFHRGSERLSLRMRRRSGVAFDAEAVATPTSREIYWSVSDRTEEVQAETRLWELNEELEQRLAEQAREMETLAARLPVGVLVLGPTGEVVWSNTRAREILDGSVDVIAPYVAAAFAGDEIRSARTPVERGDGRKIVVEVNAASLGGRAGGIAVVVDDITQRDRLERADAEFVENAAHQLRNPITAIAMSVAALDAGAREDEHERQRFLDHIARESGRMASLVDALLTLAALQRGTARPNVEVVRLRTLLDSTVATPRARVPVVVDCPEELAVVGDGALLAEALGNVVDNATRHARSLVRIEARPRGELALVDVSDDGPGIPFEDRERVFQRFYRAAGNHGAGSGLGLAIAVAAARAALGTLELVPTVEGRGTTFRLTVPGARIR